MKVLLTSHILLLQAKLNKGQKVAGKIQGLGSRLSLPQTAKKEQNSTEEMRFKVTVSLVNSQMATVKHNHELKQIFLGFKQRF